MNDIRNSMVSDLDASLVQSTVEKVDTSMNYLLEAHIVLDSQLGIVQKKMINVLRLMNSLGFDDKIYYDITKIKQQVSNKLKKLKDRVEGRNKKNGVVSDLDQEDQ
jgi:hypothetical protein